MRSLTDRQQQILEWIKHFIQEYGIPPTRAELAHGVGLSDASCVGPHLETLARKGWIELFPRKNRGIRVLEQHLPLVKPLAEVAAGTPILSEAHIVQHVPAAIANLFRPRPDYLLTVRGDSMDRTGLQDADIVGIRRTPIAQSGQVVVARFGDEVTLKRFRRIDDRHVELHAESYNPAHKPMYLDLAKHVLEIDGIAVGALIGEIRDNRFASAPKEDELTELPEFLRELDDSTKAPETEG
jgi:repressor LexA